MRLLRALASEAASLDRLSREMLRERIVRALDGKIHAPSRLVDAALKPPHVDDPDTHSGRPLTLEDPDPWPEAVQAASLLDELEAVFLRFVVLPEGAAAAVALWWKWRSVSISAKSAIQPPSA